MSLNKRARALESRFEKELKPLRANVQKGFQSAVQKSAEIKQEVTHMVYSALHDATQPIKVRMRSRARPFAPPPQGVFLHCFRVCGPKIMALRTPSIHADPTPLIRLRRFRCGRE